MTCSLSSFLTLVPFLLSYSYSSGTPTLAGRLHLRRRGVAQFGSALPWGGRGRTFESCRPDQYLGLDLFINTIPRPFYVYGLFEVNALRRVLMHETEALCCAGRPHFRVDSVLRAP